MSAWSFDVQHVLRGIDTRGVSREMLAVVLKAVASDVMGTIIHEWPIDTALSVAGFRTRAEGASWVVYNDVDYTPYVHDGIVDVLAAAGLDAAVPRARAMVDVLAGRKKPDADVARPKLRRRSRGRARVAVRQIPVAAVRQASAASSMEARALRDALRVVGPLDDVPGAVLTMVRSGQLARAARDLRGRGLRGAARKLEAIDRRGRRV